TQGAQLEPRLQEPACGRADQPRPGRAAAQLRQPARRNQRSARPAQGRIGRSPGAPGMTALLTDNLPLLAGAPNGIKKLRELILELAVRGKLVPQDPSDEPASELLKRIAEEKARLVAEGKIKKQKPLAEIGEEEKPFELPEQWQWVRLGEIAEIIRGVTYNKSDASDAPLAEYAPLLRGNNINRTLNFDRPVF